MATDRRTFLSSLITLPTLGIAGCHIPAYASQMVLGGAQRNRQHLVAAMEPNLGMTFEIPVPGRLHGVARHPSRPEAVVFARRPGTFAVVLDTDSGRILDTIHTPPGRHFYGHGVFSADGNSLYATENDFENARGVVGVYDAGSGYKRAGEFSSIGIGPHEIIRLPATNIVVVANGGVATHPDTGRAPLNPDTMQSSLAYFDADDGRALEQLTIPNYSQLSIRHLTASRNGLVGIGIQHKGDRRDLPPLVAVHRRGAALREFSIQPDLQRGIGHYIGSVRFTDTGRHLFASAPRGGKILSFELESGTMASFDVPDGCGLHPIDDGILVSSGEGVIRWIEPVSGRLVEINRTENPMRWDNHLG